MSAEGQTKFGKTAEEWHEGFVQRGQKIAALEARLSEVEGALREARPYVFQRIDHGNITEQRSATAVDVLGRVDAALDSPATQETGE